MYEQTIFITLFIIKCTCNARLTQNEEKVTYGGWYGPNVGSAVKHATKNTFRFDVSSSLLLVVGFLLTKIKCLNYLHHQNEIEL